MKRRLYITGYYGMFNFGDELFQAALLQNSGSVFPGFDVRVARPRFRSEVLRRAYARRGRAGALLRAACAVWYAARASVLILGGGSVLTGLRGVRSLQWMLAPVTRTRFGAVGISIGPFSSAHDESRARAFLSNFDRLVVRDEHSMMEASRLGAGDRARLGGDIAALYNYPHRDSRDVGGHRRVLGYLPCAPATPDMRQTERVCAALGVAVDDSGLVRSNVEVVVFALDTHEEIGDERVASRAVSTLTDMGFAARIVRFENDDVEEVCRQIGQLDGAWAVRLHGAIVSYLSGVPFVMQSYHQKCEAFADEIGLPAELLASMQSEPEQLQGAWRALLRGDSSPRLSPSRYASRARAVYSS
ncbi:polysaccharide pyruvyl transferase family protein [Yonghaparkia sp. Root332]|uniref:polysaccharide pyruvyl transferase family protein n=1 Tax=Yonghaparkia sp. Root332 TaxID=1736516 RepID=UPI0006F48536|nr:polysaccharide pyruvyl transferase family protein [Yonghaparkia sp. Root332]KQV25453.1 hypothetical protein ASC54_00105 [Yonghaparkia sp. Root332]